MHDTFTVNFKLIILTLVMDNCENWPVRLHQDRRLSAKEAFLERLRVDVDRFDLDPHLAQLVQRIQLHPKLLAKQVGADTPVVDARRLQWWSEAWIDWYSHKQYGLMLFQTDDTNWYVFHYWSIVGLIWMKSQFLAFWCCATNMLTKFYRIIETVWA